MESLGSLTRYRFLTLISNHVDFDQSGMIGTTKMNQLAHSIDIAASAPHELADYGNSVGSHSLSFIEKNSVKMIIPWLLKHSFE